MSPRKRKTEPAAECVYCHREIGPGERRYLSRQAGMRGLYHWECFVEACRKANRAGMYEIESITVNESPFDNFTGADIINDS